MGLDQYLELENENGENKELIYWRKANQIHGWFDRFFGGVENCEEYNVTIDTLKLLKADCEKVLNDEVASEQVLPIMKGSFFGNYEYDELYFQKLKYTVDKINEILYSDMIKIDDEMYYFAWW